DLRGRLAMRQITPTRFVFLRIVWYSLRNKLRPLRRFSSFVPRRSVIAAICMGVLASAAAWCWPVSPIWSTGIESASMLLGFGDEGRVLYAALDESFTANSELRWEPTRVLRFDAENGRLLGSWKINLAEFGRPLYIW